MTENTLNSVQAMNFCSRQTRERRNFDGRNQISANLFNILDFKIEIEKEGTLREGIKSQLISIYQILKSK